MGSGPFPHLNNIQVAGKVNKKAPDFCQRPRICGMSFGIFTGTFLYYNLYQLAQHWALVGNEFVKNLMIISVVTIENHIGFIKHSETKVVVVWLQHLNPKGINFINPVNRICCKS